MKQPVMQQICRSAIVGGILLSLSACGGAPSPNGNAPSNSATPASPLGLSSASPSSTPSPSPTPSPTTKAAVPAVPNPAPVATPDTAPAASADTAVPTQTLAANSSQTQDITVYQLDNQCEEFVAQKVTIPTKDAATTLVGKVIANSNSPDFKIDNYRIQVENGTATIDLRLPPGAKRPFAAMSACEQRSLLGSLSKTLTSNPALKINTVNFTDGKEQLVF